MQCHAVFVLSILCYVANTSCAGAGADLELQPNASAPLLRTSKARREWIDQEMELCSTSWQYQKVLEGELAQRADATRKLREVQKQLMLLGGLVPPSPVVTAAAAAAARGRRNSSNLQSGASGGSSSGGLGEEAALMQEAKVLQDAIDSHTRSVKVSAAAAHHTVILSLMDTHCTPVLWPGSSVVSSQAFLARCQASVRRNATPK